MTDRLPSDDVPSPGEPIAPDAPGPGTPPPDIQEIGSASRSCLVILGLVVVIVLLVCVSWLTRILF